MISAWRCYHCALLVCLAAVAGCATSGSDSAGYRNFLVLGLADDYENRAYFESEAVADLRRRGAQATAYHRAVGGNKPIDRESVRAVARSGGYDAVLVTRVLDRSMDVEREQGSVATKATRRDGRPLDFFRYDYEELDEPEALRLQTAVTLSIEVYDAASEQQVWVAELKSSKADSIGELIEDTAAAVIRRLARNDLIAR